MIASRHNFTWTRITSMVPLAALVITLQCTAQAPVRKVEEQALGRLSLEMNRTYGQVRFHREEDLEDRFISSWPGADPAALPHFYLIQRAQLQALNGGAASYMPSSMPTMYVATNPEREAVYRLYGFASAEEEFSHLVKDLPIQTITGRDQAQARGLTCGEMVYGLSSEWWVDGEPGVLLQAVKHFFASGHKDALLLAGQWWRKAKGDRDVINIATVRNVDGTYLVNLPIFWAPVEGDIPPQVKAYQIKVSVDGICHMDPGLIKIVK